MDSANPGAPTAGDVAVQKSMHTVLAQIIWEPHRSRGPVRRVHTSELDNWEEIGGNCLTGDADGWNGDIIYGMDAPTFEEAEYGSQGRNGPTDFLVKNPRFWTKVQQLRFHLRSENQAPRVLEFYQEYGGLGYKWDTEARRASQNLLWEYEPWGWALVVTTWFNGLVQMVKWLKEHKMEPLRDIVGQPRELKRYESRVWFYRPGPAWPELYKRYERMREYEISASPVIVGGSRTGTKSLPRDDAELRECAWEAILRSVMWRLNRLKLVPATVSARGAEVPQVYWGIVADGALDAAFLQWYFTELAGVGSVICAAAGCGQPVLPPRKRFCSERCRQREKKRRQREKEVERNGRTTRP